MRSVGWLIVLLISCGPLLSCSGNEPGRSGQLLQGLELSPNDDLLTLTVADATSFRAALNRDALNNGTAHVIQNGLVVSIPSIDRALNSCALSGSGSDFKPGERIQFITRREGDKLAATSLNGDIRLICAKAEADPNDWSVTDLNVILGPLASASGELLSLAGSRRD
jgi:hypothetical protein